MHNQRRLSDVWGPAVCLVLAVVCGAVAQPEEGGTTTGESITATVGTNDFGLNDVWRLGEWTPMRVTLSADFNKPRQVDVEWSLPDEDGDLVLARRSVTVQGGRRQGVWLYGVPRRNYSARESWQIRVLDSETGQLLTTQSFKPVNEPLQTEFGVVGVIGSRTLGLQRYEDEVTQHEPMKVVSELKPNTLPDRWFGLSMCDMIVWTPDGGDPLSRGAQGGLRSVRRWVERGGHLVIVMPSVGGAWMDPLVADLVPSVKLRQLNQVPPPEFLLPTPGLSPSRRQEIMKIGLTAHALDPSTEANAEPILWRDGRTRTDPLVVARQVGFGRVTLIGIDLTDQRLVRLGMPMAESPFWRIVTGWQSPAYTKLDLKRMLEGSILDGERSIKPASSRRGNERELTDSLVADQLGMTGSAFGSLMLALFVFAGYWIVAGPVAFAVLKARKQPHHAWVAFVIIVAIFSMITWGGAALLRPQRTGVQHYTVLTYDGTTGLTHAHSWVSLMVPRHGRVEVELASDEVVASPNTLASPGLKGGVGTGGFLDEQRYVIDTGKPVNADVPFRATTKKFELDYLGRSASNDKGEGDDEDQAPAGWAPPVGGFRLVAGRPVGTLTHNLPAGLTDIRIIYCPGRGQVPYMWEIGRPQGANRKWRWEAETPLKLDAPPKWVDLTHRLVRPVRDGNYFVRPAPNDNTTTATFKHRDWGGEGILGKWQKNDIDQEINRAVALSFYNYLPPPDFVNHGALMSGLSGSVRPYYRQLGRAFDLSHLGALPRVIVIARVTTKREDDAPLPVPFTVDGDTVPSSGETLVRWILPVK